LLIHSTCSGCGGASIVTDGAPTHAFCTPKLNKVEKLGQRWMEAVEAGDNTELEAELQRRIDEFDDQPPRLGEAALIYASWGWPVFPLLPLSQAQEIAERTGEPLNKVAKRPHIKNGLKGATTDEERIRTWWKKYPDCNLGIASGHAFDVIDIDPRDGGHLSLAKVIAAEDPRTGLGPIPEPYGQVATASGGVHFYVKPRGGRNKTAVMPGVDIRAMDGYVVGPPSWLGTRGRGWSWTYPASPSIKEVTQ
jgi:hypothetical protein